MKQLSLEHFRAPLKGENQLLEAPPAHEFRSPSDIPELPAIPTAPAPLRPFVSTPEYQAPKICSHAELICILTSHLPLNDYKLPTHIYRPDLLDPRMFNDLTDGDYQKVLSFLEASGAQVTYHEGYPAIQDSPFWAQLPWESGEDFQLFEQYRLLPGARQLHLLPGNTGGRAAALFHTNYWAFRVQASDAFAVVHYQRMRQQRILQTDDSLFLESQQLFTKLKALIPTVNWDALKEEPDKFVKVFGQVTEIMRKALGSDKQTAEPSKAAQNVEVTMRSLIQQPGQDATQQSNAVITEDGDIDIREVLRKAGDVSQLQELVLRVSK